MLLDGRFVANTITNQLKQRINVLKIQNVNIALGVILVGSKIESQTYVNMKQKKCESLGINCVIKKFDDDVTQQIIETQIQSFNNDKSINGILVQLPLPQHINTNALLRQINIEKDVDGFNPVNAGSLSQNNHPLFYPCTPRGCIELLDHYKIDIKGKNATIIGCSNLVGLPLSLMLLHRDATVTICHKETKNLQQKVKDADLIFACCGSPGLVKKNWVKKGATVVDVGINKIEDNSEKGYKLVGDVDYDNVKSVAANITPVPGGIGPMTIAILMKQIVEAREHQRNCSDVAA
jgi:5,10-methylene-tetrahydrofolate dehydrogenase/methenyl tetrahydrofolate cyclohydrolase